MLLAVALAAAVTLPELVARVEKEGNRHELVDYLADDFELPAHAPGRILQRELSPKPKSHWRTLQVVYGPDGEPVALIWADDRWTHKDNEATWGRCWSYKSSLDGTLLAAHRLDEDYVNLKERKVEVTDEVRRNYEALKAWFLRSATAPAARAKASAAPGSLR